MICVECGHTVASVYRRLTPNKFRLTYCDHCSNIADKYVEYEFILILFDLLLLSPQAYRHILFNQSNEQISRGLALRILIAVLLFDAYLLSVQGTSTTWGSVGFGDYSLGLLRAGLGFVAFYVGCRMALKFLVSTDEPATLAVAADKLGVALIVSNFGKCFVLLMVIWEYPPAFSAGLDLFVYISNAVAVGTLLQSDWRRAVVPVAVGLACRMAAVSLGFN